jgi:hypothetical protein
MYRGLIVRHYNMSAVIDVLLEVSANHLGWSEFRLCSLDNRGDSDADHECLNKTLLTDPTGKITRFPMPFGHHGPLYLKVALPPGICCKHCVFQVGF